MSLPLKGGSVPLAAEMHHSRNHGPTVETAAAELALLRGKCLCGHWIWMVASSVSVVWFVVGRAIATGFGRVFLRAEPSAVPVATPSKPWVSRHNLRRDQDPAWRCDIITPLKAENDFNAPVLSLQPSTPHDTPRAMSVWHRLSRRGQLPGLGTRTGGKR